MPFYVFSANRTDNLPRPDKRYRYKNMDEAEGSIINLSDKNRARRRHQHEKDKTASNEFMPLRSFGTQPHHNPKHQSQKSRSKMYLNSG